MHKLLRLHMDNVGHPGAFFDGVTIPFTHPETDEPADTVLHAMNGSGKTTALALFFSCFDTRVSRFLRTLSKRHERFEDCFNARPALIAVEWLREGGSRLVTGQIVVPHTREQGVNLDRFFFSFRPDTIFGFDDLPSRRIGQNEKSRLGTRDEVVRWLQQCAHLRGASHGFFRTDNQRDWQARLEAEKIDVELLAQQVDLNKDEGGIDAFLRFDNEAHFVRRFLDVVMDDRRAKDVRADLSEGLHKLAGLDKLAERARQLQSLVEYYDRFCPTADAARRVKAALAKAEAVAGALKRALLTQARKLEADANALDEQVHEVADRIAEKSKQKRETADQQAVYEAALEEQKAREARRTCENSERHRDKLRLEQELYEAAREWAPIAGASARLEELDRAIAQETISITIPKREAEAAGDALYSSLQRFIADRRNEFDATRRAIEQLGQERLKAQETTRILNGEVEGVQKQAAEICAWLEHAEKTKALLIAKGYLAEGTPARMSVYDALEHDRRLDVQIARAEGAVRELESRLSALSDEKERLQRKEGATEAQLESEQSRLAKAQDRRDVLANDPYLTELCAAAPIDPESPSVDAALTECVERSRTAARRAQREREVKEADAESIQRTGLAAVDENTSRLANFLDSHGVRGAMPFASWLAGQDIDPEAIRDFAGHFPARFAGVAVQGKDAYERAQALDFSNLGLTRTIVISRATIEPAEAAADAIVVTVDRPEAYDRAQARLLLDTLQKQIQGLEEEIANADEDDQKAREARQVVSAWVTDWGAGRLARLAANCAELHGQLARLAEQLTEHQVEIEGIHGEIRSRRDEVDQVKDERGRLAVRIEHLEIFVNEFENQEPEKRAQLQQVEHEIEEARAAQSNIASRIEAIDREIEDRREDLRSLERTIEEFEKELATIELRSGDELKSDPERLEEQRVRYRQLRDNYRALLADKVEVLQAQRDEVAKTRGENLARYRRLHPDVEQVEVSRRAALPDLEGRLRRSTQQWEQAAGDAGAARNEAKDAEQRAKHFRTGLAGRLNPLLGPLLTRTRSDLEMALERFGAEFTVLETELPQLEQEREAVAKRRDQQIQYAKLSRTHANAFQEDLTAPLGDLELEVEEKQLERQVGRSRKALSDAQQALRETRDTAEREFEKIRAFAQSDLFQEADARLSNLIRVKPLEDAIAHADSHATTVAQTLAAVENDQASVQSDFDYQTERLEDLLRDAQLKLRLACERGVVPDRVERLGGHSVLRMPVRFNAVAVETRRHVIRQYIERLIKTDRIPESGHAIAADLIDEMRQVMNRDRLGIEILKPNDVGDIQYCPIDRLASSGGEGLTAALLLYLVLSRLRAEGLADTRTAMGGVLLVDNPFGKVTHSLFLRTQRELARAMDVQLVFTTNVKDLDSVGEFPHVVKMAKEERELRRGRALVRVSRHWIKEPGPAFEKTAEDPPPKAAAE
ncbi:MAG: hypothetical protein GKS00_24855 [Alphaproteobacteria bacterium]|nr:hypothetical protein [Alphaproteobacteria bacterium]